MEDRRRNLRGAIFRESVSEEVSEELAFHAEMRSREYQARGMSREEAEKKALALFGDIRGVRAECERIGRRREQDMRRSTFWSEWRQDAAYAVRQLRTSPGFSFLVIATLALGIGASTTIFSAVNAVVLRPFAFRNPDRVTFLWESWKEFPTGNVSISNFEAWRAHSTQFATVAARNRVNYNISAEDGPERISGAAVTNGYFDIFGVHPALGRTFTADEDREGGPRVAMLSWQVYHDRFNEDPSIIGRDIPVNGAPTRVVGVMPAGFDPTLDNDGMWTPAQFSSERREHRDEHYLIVLGKLKPGATLEKASQELATIAAVERAKYPQENSGRNVTITGLRDNLISGYDTKLYLLLGAVLLVLLIACANVANLLLARGASRQSELAVRAALGAGRGRIFRQLLTENLVLGLATVPVSLAIAEAGIKFIIASAPSGIPRIAETRIDMRVLVFAIALAVCSSIIFGLAPALRAVKSDLQNTLRIGGRDARPVVRDWVRSALITVEVALSVLLLVGAGLLIRTGMKVNNVDSGFRIDNVVTARVTLSGQTYADPDAARTTFENIIATLKTSPAVQSAAISSQVPLGPGGNSNGVIPEGKPLAEESAVDARLKVISDDFMNVMGIAMLHGRPFGSHDVRGGTRVAIVSKALADKLWPGENPIGKRLVCCEGGPQDPMYKTVIGVAADVHAQGPTLDPRPEFYLPLAQTPDAAWNWLSRSMTLAAVSRESTAALTTQMRSAVNSVAPNTPVYDVNTMRDLLHNVTAPARFNTMMLTLLGVIGMTLAAIGIFGVVSYFVNLRTREIGVRIALGASSRSVVALMTRQALAPVFIGMLVGVALAASATKLLTASLYQVTPTDPVTFASVIMVLLAVAILAVIGPARRASHVSPTTALTS